MKLTALMLCAGAAFAADYLPLATGNSWTYRDAAGFGSFTIRVGLPLATQDGNTYYRVTGYVDRALWVRAEANGNLLYRDEESGRDLLLTSFEAGAPGWANAPFRICEQESQADAKSQPYNGAVGAFGNTMALRYRSFSCADAGVESEVYVPNLGLMRRTVTTIAGPRVYELSEARVGGFIFGGRPAAAFHAAVQSGPGGRLTAALRLNLASSEPLNVTYNTLQEYDLVVWDENGRQVYRWSDGKAFGQAQFSRTISGGLAHEVEIATPQPLPDGAYLMEAWLAVGPSQRDFSAMTPFRITDGKLVQ